MRPIKESVYTDSFTVDPSVPRPKPKPYEERKQYTNDLRRTHFCLGNWDTNNTSSETKHSIGFVVGEHEDKSSVRQSFLSSESATNGGVDRNRHESKVFRDGDWNRTDRKPIRSSVTMEDFHPSFFSSKSADSLKFTHEYTKPGYHRATHFDLGNVSSTPTSNSCENKMKNGIGVASLYRKDFAAKPLTYAFDRDRACRRLGDNPTLELFPENNKTEDSISNHSHFITTKEMKFKNHGTEHLLSTVRDRHNEVFGIRQRNGRDSHQIYDHQMTASPSPRPSSSTTYRHHGSNLNQQLPVARMLSMSSSDFRKPPLTKNNKCDITVPVNNHLGSDSNDLAAFLTMSEARDKYRGHMTKTSRQVHQECHDRRSDNKSTHFVFGSTGFLN